jgi:hypothetical protein
MRESEIGRRRRITSCQAALLFRGLPLPAERGADLIVRRHDRDEFDHLVTRVGSPWHRPAGAIDSAEITRSGTGLPAGDESVSA